MATKAAQKRLTKEYVAMQRDPPPFIWAAPDEKNILTWNYIIRGPGDSAFAGGEYHGVLLFPAEYPFKPPGIKMLTPSGRFQPDRKICFSMSDFHPGSWNPAWSVATILTGLLSFMLSDEITTGAIKSNNAQKHHFAVRSHAWNITQARFKEAFPEYCDPVMKDLPNMGGPPSNQYKPTAAELSSPFFRPFLPPTSQPVVVPQPATPATTLVPAASTTAIANPQDANVDVVAVNWVNSMLRMLWDRWRWGVLIALAVIVSRVSSK